MDDCNTALKINGKLCPCKLGLGHLGNHEFKRLKKEHETDISTNGAITGLLICTGILALFYFTTTEGWLQPIVWWNPVIWGLIILTVFGFVGWLICFGTLISNLYWSRKPDEIWVKDTRPPDPNFYSIGWIKSKQQITTKVKP